MEKKLTPVKKINLNAPRFGKGQYIYQVVCRKLFLCWRRESGYREMTLRQFKNIWELIAAEVRLQVVENTHGVRLPFFNGDISTNYVDMLRRHINTKASQEQGYIIHHLDWHSNKRPGKICWSVRHAMRQNRWVRLYGFDACRELTKAASEGFKNHPEIFRMARTTHYIAAKLQERK